MKTIILAIITLLGATIAVPEADARDRDHRRGRYYKKHSYRHYPRYYSSRPRYYYRAPRYYYRPSSYYYSSYPYYYSYPRTYYRRPGISLHFGF